MRSPCEPPLGTTAGAARPLDDAAVHHAQQDTMPSSTFPSLGHLRAAWPLLLLALATGSHAQTESPAGRLLASNCFQCHGTNGKGPGFERLAGRSARDLYEKQRSFASGKEGQDLMARHAMGYTDAQQRLIARYFASQR